MPLNPIDLSNDLIAAFSTSSDPATKALTDAFYVQMAICITDHIKRGVCIVPSGGGTIPVT